jgi:carboxyl-terminal processing protease
MSPNKFSSYKVYLPVLFAIVLMAGIYLGLQLRSTQSSQTEKRFFSIGFDRYDKINDIINYIYDSYVDSVSRIDLTEEVIQTMLQNLDPHSAYIPASEFRELNDPLMGSFEGIGIEFNMISDTVVVISPIAGGPSEKAGIMPGDRIIAVESDPIAGVKKSTSEVVSLLKGKKGTEVNVDVLRSGVSEPLQFKLIRDKIPSYSLDIAYMIDEQTGYIRLNKFSATTHQEFLSALNRLKQEGMEQMILDLRDNGGGFLEAAINIADELLESQKLIVYTDGRQRPRSYAYARKKGGFENQPLIVLINEWSASASEIIAGAVQDNDRGLVIGRRSFGKGLVQEQVQLADGSALRLTVARYYTPTGRSIQKPYDNGQEEYYSDFMQRYLDGELEDPDNIKFNDSLKFETPAGRIVYGGGGIMPDIFIPLETGGQTTFFNQTANRGLIYRFAFDYADKNRSTIMQTYNDAQHFVNSFSVDAAIFRQFIGFVEEQGMNTRTNNRAASDPLIRNHLKAYIGRNVFGSEAFFPVLNTNDPTLQKALEAFKDYQIITTQTTAEEVTR